MILHEEKEPSMNIFKALIHMQIHKITLNKNEKKKSRREAREKLIL